MGGMSRSPEDDVLAAYSPENLPPHWKDVRQLLYKRHGGDMKKGIAFLKGGWKNVPENERWWDKAMSGEVEQLRRSRLEGLLLIKSGMENARRM